MSLDTLNEKQQKISDMFAAGIVFSEEGGGKLTNDDFKKTLPEDLPYETVARVQDHLVDCTLALHHAGGRAGIDQMAANANLSSVVITAAFGKDQVSTDVQRSSTFRNPRTGETNTKPGATTTRYIARGGKRGTAYQSINAGLLAYASERLSS